MAGWTVRRVGFVAAMFLVSIALAQTVPEAGVTPEMGYVSDFRYINAFFGFTLPLPHDPAFRELPIRSDGNSHFLFGLEALRRNEAVRPGMTVLSVQATKAAGPPDDEAQKAAAGPKGKPSSRMEIGKREFWRAESEEKSPAGKMRKVTYTAAMNGYKLEFIILAFDAKLGKELQQSVESISFFDPAQAKAVAGSNARPVLTKPQGMLAAPVTAMHIGELSPGAVSGNTFTDDALGFTFQFPAGWALADKATQDRVMQFGHQQAWGNDPAAAREHEAFEQCSRILLWANKYPEGMKTEEINPLIAIMAFDPACMPGVELPKSAQDTEGIRQLASQISSSLSGMPFLGKGRNSVGGFTRQGHLFIDLSSAFRVKAPSGNQQFDVFTSMIVTQANGYWVMWAFINGSQAGMNQLRGDVRITFAPPASAGGQK